MTRIHHRMLIAVLLLGGCLVLHLSALAGSKPPAANAKTAVAPGKTTSSDKTPARKPTPVATPDTPANLIQPETLIVSKKKGYLYIVWDVYAHRKKFDPKRRNSALTALRYAAYIAQAHGFQKYPDYPEARVNIIVFNERDEYGGPRWDSVEKYYAYTVLAKKYTELEITDPERIWTLKEKMLRALLAEPKGKK